METISTSVSFGGELRRVKHRSDSCDCDMIFGIYLPPQANKQPVPTLFWLSGLTCTDENFMLKAGALRVASELGLAIVCPDTSPRGTDFPGEHDSYDFGSGAGFYVNATREPWSANYHMYDYVTQELPELVRNNFPLTERCGISGLFSRGGRARVVVKALDHDFKPEKKLTPFGIFLPEHDELYLYFTASRVTSDFIADCLDDCWHEVQVRFPAVRTLLLNLDNGPENHSRRTQFMKRMTEFADHAGLTVSLAYYPPYHSKYNPIERVWGVLEQHWNGSLLDSVETVLGFARTMKWKGAQAVVKLVERSYQTGVHLSKKAMARLEERLERLVGLERWFVRIVPQPQAAFG